MKISDQSWQDCLKGKHNIEQHIDTTKISFFSSVSYIINFIPMPLDNYATLFTASVLLFKNSIFF